MTTKLAIANRALLAVGSRQQISSLEPSDGSVEANTCALLFQPTFESLARAAYWNCLTAQVTLSLVAAASGTPENPSGDDFILPPTPWNYAYSYPSDCIAVRYILPSMSSTSSSTPETTLSNSAGLWLPSGNQIQFTIATMLDQHGDRISVILTNQSQADIVYTINLNNPGYWDSMFQEGMVASFGAFLAPPLALSLPLMQLCIMNAEKIITQARTRDANEGVTVLDHTPDWFLARAGSGGTPGTAYYPGGAYLNVNWPSG